jgi:NAD(P)H-hydrate epimerase
MSGKDRQNPSELTPFASREPTSPIPDAGSSKLRYPLYELDVEQIRELDRIAIEEYGIPSIVLMENAARGLREHALSMMREMSCDRAVIFCGPGNNGGDGLALARHLSNHRARITIVLAHDPDAYKGDARTNLEIVRRMGIEILDAESSAMLSGVLIVDALFGTGISRAPQGRDATLIRAINAARSDGCRVLAVDTPSGLDAQSGERMEPCVIADRTVTLAALKRGFSVLDAQQTLGEVVVADIGAPIELLDRLGTRVRRPAGSGGDSSLSD